MGEQEIVISKLSGLPETFVCIHCGKEFPIDDEMAFKCCPRCDALIYDAILEQQEMEHREMEDWCLP